MKNFIIENGILKYIGKDSIVYIPEEIDDADIEICDAFIGCSFIKKIVIHHDIDMVRFYGVDNLEEVEVDPNNPYHSSLDGIVYNKEQTEVQWCPRGKKGKIVLPNTVKTIDAEAFEDCKYLESIYIPASVESLIDKPFFNCPAEIIIDPENQHFVVIDDVIYTKDMWHVVHCSQKKKGELVLPKSVNSTYYAAFAGCSLLTSIVFNTDFIHYFGDYSFNGCTSLESIVIPQDVYSFGDNDVLGEIFIVRVEDDVYQNSEEIENFIIPRIKAVYFEGPLEMAISTDFYRFIVEADRRSVEMFYKDGSTYVKFSILEDKNGPIFGNYYDFEIDEDGELYKYRGPDNIDLVIPSNVKNIYYEVFNKYDGTSFFFNSFFIPKSLEEDLDGIGYNFINTKLFVVDPKNPYFTAIDGDLYNKDGTVLYRCTIDDNRECFEVPSTVRYIAFGAFWGCEFKTIIVPNTVTVCSTSCFSDSNVIMHVSPAFKFEDGDFEADECNYVKEMYFEMDEASARKHQVYLTYQEAKQYVEITTKMFYLKDGEYVPFE